MNRYRRTLLLGLLLTLYAASAQAQAWRPVRPQGGKDRVTLVEASGASSPKTWTVMAAGDTLSLAYSGQGELRIDLRPFGLSPGTKATMRTSVLFADGSSRRFKRISADDGTFTLASRSGETRSERLGDVDRVRLDLEPGTSPLRFVLRATEGSGVLVRLLVRGPVTALRPSRSVSPAGGNWSFEAGVAGFGYTDNVRLTPADSTNAEGAFFWPARAELGFQPREALPFELRARYRFEGDFHAEPVHDEVRHALLVDESFELGERGPLGRTELRLDQRLRTKNDTFFGRGTDEEIETSSGVGPTRVSLADRFDYAEVRLRGGLESNPREDWQLILDGFWTRRNYLEDYETEPGIYALDQNRIGGDLEVRYRPSDYELSIAFGVQNWNYDEKFSRRLDGTEVPSEPTELRRLGIDVAGGYAPRHGLRYAVGLGHLVTRDQFEGYWDRKTTSLVATAGWRDRRDLSVDLRIRRAWTDYDNATLDYDPTRPLREKSSWKFQADAEWEFRPRWTAVAELEYVDYDNNSRRFAYQRMELVLGLVFSY